MPHPTPYTEREDWLNEREQWRRDLPPSPVPDFLTGLNLRAPDPRDHSLLDLPDVAAAYEAGVPESADIIKDFLGPVLNQGAVPSCVMHTMAHMQSILQKQEENVARVFNAPQAHNETGAQDQGRDPTQALQYCQRTGMPLANAGTRYRIASYAFAPTTSVQAWTDAIKAAIAAGRPVPICFLLPSNFGWESSGSITQGYHEVLGIGYRPGALLILNSWSAQWGGGSGPWGRGGLGWVPFDFLTQDSFQRGYTQAHSGVIDERVNPQPNPQPQPDPQPQPQPDPQPQPTPSRLVVVGHLSGGGLEFVQRGTVLQTAGGGHSGQLTVTERRLETDPSPDPQPDPQPQPDPDPSPDPQPEPVNELEVRPRIWAARGGWNMHVYVKDPQGSVGLAQVTVTGATARMVWHQASLDGRMPATASLKGPAGGEIVITATAGTRRGQATAVLPGAGELPELLDE